MARLGVSASVLMIALSLSCGDDSSDPKDRDGGGPSDAAAKDSGVGEDAIIIDAWSGGTDGGAPCGTETCDTDTQICVACNCGGPTSYRCLPVPAGCENDRSCACLTDDICSFVRVEVWCVDQERDSTILCETGLD
jgi:hypothetical protein